MADAWPYDARWRKVRRVVLERDGHVCQIKGPTCTTRATHVDHIVPLVEGGARLDVLNLRASCPACNLARGHDRVRQIVDVFAHTGQVVPSREW